MSGAGPCHSPCPGPVTICLNEVDVIIATIHILCFTGDDISPIRCPTDGMSICGSLTAKGLNPNLSTFTICPEEVNPALAHPADEPRIANHNVGHRASALLKTRDPHTSLQRFCAKSLDHLDRF